MVLDLLSGKTREPAEAIIKVGTAGEEVVDLYPFITELTAEISRQEAGVATLKFESRRDEQGVWTVQDAGVLAPWEPIVIEAAFGSTTEEVLRGYIREVSASYPEDAGNTTVTVQVQDDSIALDREQMREVWGGDAPTDDATILAAILARHGLSPHPDNATGLTGLVLNQDATDIRFLRQRAEANGYELIFQEGTVYFGPMRLEAEPQATILVYAGRGTNCYRFDVKADGHQPDAVAFDAAAEQGAETVQDVIAPDLPLLGTTAADSTSSGLGDFTWRMVRQGSPNEEELRARAQQRANEMSMRVKAEGELDGSLYGHVLRVGEPVPVDGVGDWLGGLYYVDAVSHKFTLDGYRQSFKLMRNAYGDNFSSGGDPLAGVL
ncbi:MAG: hypothetical protein OES32_06455 [Acidobacteriota bacterium]|nr:hypothetical protein [Acidobacteriota bacterium]MDH3523210.1 hypothetical protein [Acidobacteriota bacterium]